MIHPYPNIFTFVYTRNSCISHLVSDMFVNPIIVRKMVGHSTKNDVTAGYVNLTDKKRLEINLNLLNPEKRYATITTVKNLLHKDKEEKETHRTLRHIWLPLRKGDHFAAKKAFVLPTHRLTVDNSFTFYNEI